MDQGKEILSKCPSCGSRYKVPLAFLGKTLTCKKCGTPFKLAPSPASSPQESISEKPLPEKPPPEEKAQEIAVEDPCRVLGKLAVKYGYASEAQVQEGLELQAKEREAGREKALGLILREQGVISEDQLDSLVSVQQLLTLRQLDVRFGAIAVQNGFADQDAIEKALQEQKRIFKEMGSAKPIGDILVEEGVISQEQKDGILERQQRLQTTAASQEPQGPFELTVSEDGLSATISLREGEVWGSVGELRELLASKGIRYGIVEDHAIEEFLKEGRPFQVAQGKPPVQGGEAVIRYLFNTDPLKVGEIKEGEVIDFRERGPVPQVKAGDLLAERVWPEDRQLGVDVFGNEISPPEEGNVFLRPGTGTRVSGDGMKLHADADGRPELRADGMVYVFSDMEVDGDVDLKTGHIDFHGNIVVAGTVQSGFRVKGGSLTANEIQKGEVETTGDVAVFGGVIGATIKAGGNLRARYIHDSTIEILGDVAVEKEIIDSKIETSGVCSVKKGHILSCQIEAKKGIEASQIGSESSRQCVLVVGTNERARREIERLRGVLAQKKQEKKLLSAQMRDLDRESQRVTAEIGKLAQEQDRALVNRRKIMGKLEEMRKVDPSGKQLEAAERILQALDQEIKERDGVLEVNLEKQEKTAAQIATMQQENARLDGEIAAIANEISSIAEWAKAERGNPVVKCSGEINQYTVIKGINSSITLPESHTGVVIQEVKSRGSDDVVWRMKISRL